MRLPPALLLTGNTALRCVPVVPTAAGIRTCVRYLTPREAFRTNLPGQPQKSTTDSVGGGAVNMKVYSLWVLEGTGVRPGSSGVGFV